MENAKKILHRVEYGKDPYETAKDADIVIIVTDWNEFKELDLGKIKEQLRSPILLDGRNIFDPKKVRELGFMYQGIGR